MKTFAFRTGEVVPGDRNGGPETAVHMGLVDLIRIELTTSALRSNRAIHCRSNKFNQIQESRTLYY